MAKTIQDKIKEVPGLMFVVENMELMSSAGRRRMLEQKFLTNTEDLGREQDAVALMGSRLENQEFAHAVTVLRHQLMQLHDIHTTLNGLQSHFVLDEVELFEVKNLAFLCANSRKALVEMRVTDVFRLPDLADVFAILDPDKTGIPNFYIYDSYDARLAPIRKRMKEADDDLMGELLAEQNEIQNQVIVRLCDKLFPYVGCLLEALEQMAYIDFVLARSVLAGQWGLVKPESPIREDGRHPIRNLFNPRLRMHNMESGLRYQPVDIDIVRGVTLITGANMAGKTVLLKSVGLLQLMYQFGFPVPASLAGIEPVDDVVFCIGDEQNEMKGLSSYASEMTRISDILQRSESERLMVLIDEPARTTNPIEGKALVQALVSIMESRDSITMITTHYSQLGVDCRRLRVKGFIETMSDMPVTAQNINNFIDYSLIVDDSDEVPHEALRIAELLDSYPALINQARNNLLNKG